MAAELTNQERLIHSTKAAIACSIAFLVTKFSGVPPNDSWLLLTVCVIMCAQIYIGDILQKSYLRFLGTLLGCFIASFVVVFIGVNTYSALVTVTLIGLLASYISTGPESISYAGTFCAISTVVVMMNSQPTVQLAVSRFIEICLGIFIATLVAHFVLPIRARDHVARLQVGVLTDLRDLYINIVNINQKNLPFDEYYQRDENIASALTKQRQLTQTLKHSWLEPAFDREELLKSIYYEKQILRAINFIYHALSHIESVENHLPVLSFLEKFNQAVITALDTLIDLAKKKDAVAENLYQLSDLLIKLRNSIQEKIDVITLDPIFNLSGFLFSAEILVQNILKLADFYRGKNEVYIASI